MLGTRSSVWYSPGLQHERTGLAQIAHALSGAVLTTPPQTRKGEAFRLFPGGAPPESDPLAQGFRFVYGAGNN